LWSGFLSRGQVMADTKGAEQAVNVASVERKREVAQHPRRAIGVVDVTNLEHGVHGRKYTS